MRDLLDRVKLEKILEGDAVYFDAVNGFAGTTHPIGTPQMPVDNVADLKTIVNARNTFRVMIFSDITLDRNMGECYFIGSDRSGTFFTLNINGFISPIVCENLCIHEGDVGGLNVFYHCMLSGGPPITNFRGYLIECNIICTISVSGFLFMFNCWGEDGAAALDLTGGHLYYFIDGCGGQLAINNLTTDVSGPSTMYIHMKPGASLFIDSTCTGGEIYVYGACYLTDLSTGTFVVDMREGVPRNSRCFQETAPAKNAAGLGWVTILDRTFTTPVIRPTRIRGIRVTVAGGWAGKARIRIVDGAGTPNLIFPFQGYYEQDTDFVSGTQLTFNFPVEIAPEENNFGAYAYKSGYQIEFCSTAAGDGPGKTLELNSLDVEEMR
jgi:hypothetical protein